jgi:hypothetical protein
MSFSIVCCLGVIEGSGFVVMVSEFVIGDADIFAYPSHSFYFIGKGDDKIIITDTNCTKSVTFLGDKKLRRERLILPLFNKCFVR